MMTLIYNQCPESLKVEIVSGQGLHHHYCNVAGLQELINGLLLCSTADLRHLGTRQEDADPVCPLLQEKVLVDCHAGPAAQLSNDGETHHGLSETTRHNAQGAEGGLSQGR
jgi:hypothetical protein